jgi:hypothetical protein
MPVVFDEAWLKKFCAKTGQKNPLEGAEGEKPVKQNKYRNRRTQRDGQEFDSKHEADRYSELQLMLRAGEIRGFVTQHTFYLPGGVKYIADFVVLQNDGTYVVEDTKSPPTRKEKAYRIKRRQMREVLGIEIIER